MIFECMLQIMKWNDTWKRLSGKVDEKKVGDCFALFLIHALNGLKFVSRS
jgi:hypothetical protein